MYCRINVSCQRVIEVSTCISITFVQSHFPEELNINIHYHKCHHRHDKCHHHHHHIYHHHKCYHNHHICHHHQHICYQSHHNRARKSRDCFASRYEIHGIISSLGTVRAQPRFQSHVKSMRDFSLLQITVL